MGRIPEKKKIQSKLKIYIKLSSDTWATPELNTPRMTLQEASKEWLLKFGDLGSSDSDRIERPMVNM